MINFMIKFSDIKLPASLLFKVIVFGVIIGVIIGIAYFATRA